MAGIEPAVHDYIAAIDPAHRALFDRVHRLVLELHPDAAVVMSYQLPTYKVGRQRLHVGVWKHGLSLYGWRPERVAEFAERHPGLLTSKGTIQLGPDAATAVTDDDLRGLVRAALGD